MYVSMPIIVAVVGIILLLLFLLMRRKSGDMIERQRREAAVRARPRIPAPATPEGEAALLAEPEVREALDAGHKIEAIKLVRERTGLGLKEAKELVERGRQR